MYSLTVTRVQYVRTKWSQRGTSQTGILKGFSAFKCFKIGIKVLYTAVYFAKRFRTHNKGLNLQTIRYKLIVFGTYNLCIHVKYLNCSRNLILKSATQFDQSVRSNIHINPLNTKRRLLHLKTQFVPRSKHFSSRL